MDDSDRATQQEELTREAELSVRKPAAEIYLAGECWNCEIATDTLFCSGECGADWQKRDDAARRSGV